MSSPFLLLSAALAVGADPIVVSGSGGCSGCGATPAYSYAAPTHNYAAPTVSYSAAACDPCGRVGLLDRLRGRFARPAASNWSAAPCGGCGAAPVVSAPVAACDPCGRQGLLPRLKAKFAGFGQRGGCGTPMAVSGYAAASCGCSGDAGWVSASPTWNGAASPAPVVGGQAWPAVGGCAPAWGTVAPAPGGTLPPQVMPNPVTPPVTTEPKKDEPKKDEPKKDEPKKDEPKKTGDPVLKPAPSPLPAVDIPVLPSLGGTSGKY